VLPQAPASSKPDAQTPSAPTDPRKADPAKAQPRADEPAGDHPALQPALPPGEPAGTGVLRVPGEAPRDVPLMSIQQDRPDQQRVEVGPITPETGVADVLLGSIGLVAVIVLASLILGAIVGGVLVFLKHRLGWGGPDKDADDHISLTER
jgi:hypothetical protein